MAKSVPATFLDHDGTVNVDYGYIHEIDEFELIDDIIDATRGPEEMDYVLTIVTNQSGIAHGRFAEAQFETLTEWMNWSLADCDVELDSVYYCPHHPQGTVEEYRRVCNCRRLHPDMLIFTRDFLHIDITASYMVDDEIEDMQAVTVASIGTRVLTRTGKPVTPEAKNVADLVISNLVDLPMAIKKQQK